MLCRLRPWAHSDLSSLRSCIKSISSRRPPNTSWWPCPEAAWQPLGKTFSLRRTGDIIGANGRLRPSLGLCFLAARGWVTGNRTGITRTIMIDVPRDGGQQWQRQFRVARSLEFIVYRSRFWSSSNEFMGSLGHLRLHSVRWYLYIGPSRAAMIESRTPANFGQLSLSWWHRCDEARVGARPGLTGRVLCSQSGWAMSGSGTMWILIEHVL